MLTWLTSKTGFKKTWTWLKHNWKAPAVIIYTIVLWFLFSQKLIDVKKNKTVKEEVIPL